jgi:hypothetical protein
MSTNAENMSMPLTASLLSDAGDVGTRTHSARLTPAAVARDLRRIADASTSLLQSED